MRRSSASSRRRIIERQGDNPCGDVIAQRLDPGRPRLVTQQAFKPFRGKPLLPAPDAGLRLAGLTHNCIRARAAGAEQNDLGTPYMLLRSVAVPNQSQQRSAGETVMDIPVRMRQTRTPQVRRESPIGFKCQI